MKATKWQTKGGEYERGKTSISLLDCYHADVFPAGFIPSPGRPLCSSLFLLPPGSLLGFGGSGEVGASRYLAFPGWHSGSFERRQVLFSLPGF